MHVRTFFTLLMFTASIASAQTQPSTAEKKQTTDIEELNNQVANLPQIKTESISKVVKLSVEQNMLAAQTSFRGNEKSAHVIVPDLRGVIQMTWFGRIDNNISVRNFQVEQRDFTDQVVGEIQTTIVALGGRLNISRISEAHSVQYVQDPPPPPDGEVRELPVKLFIDHSDPINSEKDSKLHFAAEDFTQLRRRHGNEVDRYLRPIIRDYKQEAAVFAIDPSIAWQVLGSHHTPDEKTAARVNALVPQLGADDFRQRENAMRELKQLGPQAANVLSKIDRNKLSLQQNSGIDSFLAELAPLSPEETKQFADDKSFLLDVLFNDDVALRQLAVDRLENLVGRKIELIGGEDAIVKLRSQLMPTTQP